MCNFYMVGIARSTVFFKRKPRNTQISHIDCKAASLLLRFWPLRVPAGPGSTGGPGSGPGPGPPQGPGPPAGSGPQRAWVPYILVVSDGMF